MNRSSIPGDTRFIALWSLVCLHREEVPSVVSLCVLSVNSFISIL